MDTFVNEFSGKPQLLCGKDYLRPHFSGVWFKDGYLYATDSHVLIRESAKMHKIEMTVWRSLEGKFIPSELMDILTKDPWSFNGVDRFIVWKDGFECNYRLRMHEHKPPPFEAIIKRMDINGSDKKSIIFNPLYLLKISNGLARSTFRKAKMTFQEGHLGILVRVENEHLDDQLAILMPMQEL